MEGPFNLSAKNLSKMRREPGVYVLGFADESQKNHACYAGRSDDDLARPLGEWIVLLSGDRRPRNQSERCVVRKRPDLYWREYCAVAQRAYVRECQLYHERDTTHSCNDVHPVKTSPEWSCLLCGL